jgi:hypothetical protein
MTFTVTTTSPTGACTTKLVICQPASPTQGRINAPLREDPLNEIIRKLFAEQATRDAKPSGFLGLRASV